MIFVTAQILSLLPPTANAAVDGRTGPTSTGSVQLTVRVARPVHLLAPREAPGKHYRLASVLTCTPDDQICEKIRLALPNDLHVLGQTLDKRNPIIVVGPR